jgi:autotransporter strand-loop-strand O-heptosyltransferase
MVELLRGKGYEVVVISKEDTELKNVTKQTGNPIEKTIANLLGAEFFIGMGSGLAWLSWALRKKTVLISGFSEPFTEFQTNIVRIVPPLGKCRGCFNDPSLKFERGWDWCPRGNNYECTRYITPEAVMQAIVSEGLLK